MKIWIDISYNGDDACIETRSLRVEARVSIVKERDSTHLPMPLACARARLASWPSCQRLAMSSTLEMVGRYELQQRFPVFLPTDITHLVLFPFGYIFKNIPTFEELKRSFQLIIDGFLFLPLLLL